MARHQGEVTFAHLFGHPGGGLAGPSLTCGQPCEHVADQLLVFPSLRRYRAKLRGQRRAFDALCEVVHDADDEFFYVVDGRFWIDLPDRVVELGPGQGVVVPKGVMHRPRAPERTVILMVETAAIVPTGD